jgi:non-specific serine/threonine protein kinase
VAAELLEEFAEGVWLVEFGALSDPALVPQAVASSLGVREYTERPILTVLADFLQPRHVLLILDNCEHVVRDCAQVADHVLRACPDVRILVTSQEALGVSGEVTYSVPSLSLPDLRHLPSPEELKQYEAVRLFIERAVLSRPGFAVTADNAAAVAQAVHRLDGIPLAIELAAARTKVMSVQQIAERLNDRFRLLAAGGRTVAPRHQTLKAAMDWSYDLLEEQERTLLRRLAVFAGGWTLEAAEVVCAGESIEGGHVLDLLARLVDRSLVLVQETAGGSTRYRLLETVREYGRDRLQEAGEEERTRTRHRDVYLQLAETAEPNLQGPEQSVWFDRLEAEHDNLGAALEWCKTAGDPEYWIRLAGALWRFWEVRGYWSEGRTWLEGALTQSAGLSTSGRVRVLNGAAYLAAFQGDYGRAATLAEEGLGLSRKLGDKRGTISCLNLMGLGACYLEKFDRAAELGKESLALSQASSDWWGMMDARIVLAFVARAQGDYGRASALLEESVAQIRQVGDKFRLAMGLNTLGLVKREQGDYERATALLEETLALAQELGDKWGVAFAQSNLGIVAWYRGDYERAAALFAESLRLRADLGEKRGIVTSLVGLAAVAATQGEAERAVLLFAAADVLREEISVPLPPFIRSNYEQYVTATRTGLGERRFTEAWAKGRTMALDEAIAYALGEASTRA